MQDIRQRQSWTWDAQRDGYDSASWKTLAGIPAISANKLVFNAASAIQKADILMASRITFAATVPTDPTAGDSRSFGLEALNSGAYIRFKIDGTDFTAECSDGGSLSDSCALTWDTDWAAAEAEFSIIFLPARVEFFVNGVMAGFLDNTKCPKIPLSVCVRNANADAMSVSYVTFTNAVQHSAGLSATVSVTADTEFPTASALADNEANPTTTRVGANLLGFDGTTWDRVRVNADGSLKVSGPLVTAAYDYVGVNWNAGTFTETFTFKTGGSGGTTVNTVTVVYTDATKAQVSSVTRT